MKLRCWLLAGLIGLGLTTPAHAWGQEDRNNYWHQHIREDSIVVSGVYYIDLPKICNTNTSGTELAHDTPEGYSEYMEWRTGNWIIFPGKTWHRPGYLEVDN